MSIKIFSENKEVLVLDIDEKPYLTFLDAYKVE